MRKAIKMLSIALCAAFGIGASVAMAACDNGGGSGGEVTLVVWLPKADMKFGEEVAEAFQAVHPEKEYTILFGEQAESDAGTRVLNDTENAADVFAFPSDQLMKLVNGGALNPVLEDRLTALKAEQSEAAVAAATVKVQGEDKTYAYPFTDNTYFLYYNRSKFSENDLKSIDGILAQCSASEKFAYPLNDGWYSSAFFFGAGLGYTVERDEAFAEVEVTTDFGNDTGKAVATAMYNLASNPKVKGNSNDSSICMGFENGSIIAGVSGIWNKTSIMESLGENFGAAPLPTYTLNGSQKQLIAFAGYKLYGVSQYSQVKADAHEFAKFMSSYEMQVKHFEMCGYNPTNKQAAGLDKVKNDPCVSAIQKVLLNSKSMNDAPTTLWSPMEALGNAMVGTSTTFNVEQQIKALVEAVEVHKK